MGSRYLRLTHTTGFAQCCFLFEQKKFCLSGGEEHQTLKISQITRCEKPVCYMYVENGSKNRNGTFSQKYIPNKSVPIYANAMLGVAVTYEFLILIFENFQRMHLKRMFSI